MAVGIVTDSASSVSKADQERLSITTVSLHVTKGGREIPESQLRDPDFYTRLAEMSEPPQTSQPSPEEFAAAFRRILDEGRDVLAVLISAGMSGTVQAANLAVDIVRAERRKAHIKVVDSRSNSLEEGFAVLSAAEAAYGGASLDECAHAAEETMRRTRFLFTPDTLEYLKRGGRISGASALVSMMLKISPILTAERGETGIAGVTRGAHAARRKMLTLMRKDVERYGLKRAAVQYGGDEEDAARFAADLIEPIVGEPVIVEPIPPIVAVHVGPALGVVYETEEPLR